jgi:hypothetical protein
MVSAALQLALDPDTCKALLRGLPVPRHRLDPIVLAALGLPQDGEPLLLDEELASRAGLLRPSPAGPSTPPSLPFALELDEFIAAKSELPPTLLGDTDEAILPAAGLLLLFGRGGRGKTTLSTDAALHLASGIDWLGFHVERPLRVLIVENEGPRELFRAKLERKRAHWPHPLTGAVFVYTESWGAFTLSDPEAIERLRVFIAANQIDLVIGDPLDTLGVTGVGAPDEIRAFVALMVAAGLNRDVAFWLLHHPRKERVEDELDEAAGAWGGKPDTMMRIDVQPGDRSRLSFPKVRWSRRSRRPALILAFDPEGEGYSVVAEEGEERDFLAEIEELLGDGVWRTAREIAAPKDAAKPGVGTHDRTVKATLEQHPERFEARTGEEARELGRHKNATLWCLRRASSADVADSVRAKGGGASSTLLPPYKGAESVVDDTSASPSASTLFDVAAHTPPDGQRRGRRKTAQCRRCGKPFRRGTGNKGDLCGDCVRAEGFAS